MSAEMLALKPIAAPSRPRRHQNTVVPARLR